MSIAEPTSALDEHREEAKVLAGGQSLGPLLNFRLAAPSVLIDINRIEGLEAISGGPDGLRIGATAEGYQPSG